LAKYFADAFITAGEKARKYYLNDQRLSSKPILEIQAPVDTFIFDPDKVEKDWKIAKYPGLKIVTVGNVSPLKGIEYFIEMSSILNRSYNHISFFVVGPHFSSQKAYSEKIMRMARKFNLYNLHFYGSSENIPSVLKTADIYICSSIAEASPISVWEAMSMGKAIVSTDVGDVAKFIKDGENGFIVPTKNAAALVAKATLLIDNLDLRKKLGINARKTAVKNLDVDICVKKQADFYKTIVGGL
jgi:glycosyltransferase involved in cell wall biosynthesis